MQVGGAFYNVLSSVNLDVIILNLISKSIYFSP